MISPRFFLVLSLIMTGVLSRFLPHPPNFTALNALALFGSFYFKSCFASFGLAFIVMVLSDLVIGYHPAISFVYVSFGLIAFLGSFMKSYSLLKTIKYSLSSSFIFFFVSNFGDWLTVGFYPKTIEGLSLCYFAAIPFLTTQILGDLTFSVFFFGAYAFLEKKSLFLRKC